MNTRRIGENIIWGNGGRGIEKTIGFVLRPVGALYGVAAHLRAGMYRRGVLSVRTASAPVISVGNITLGGSGKTPLVMELAREFSSRGMRPAVLTRGYGGADRARARIVSPLDSAAAVGDEAVLMARSLGKIPVARGASRADAATLVKQTHDPDLYILDDGFGHLSLDRDFDVLVVDAARGFGNGRTFPAGPLREPLASISRADAFVIRLDEAAGEMKDEAVEKVRSIESVVHRHAPGASILKMSAQIEGLVVEPGGAAIPAQVIENKRVFAFSAIGNPDSFDRSMRRAGYYPVAHLRFPDHHKYGERDIARIAGAESLGAQVILTTEKDLVRFPKGRTGNLPLYALRIRMEVENLKCLADLFVSKLKNR